MVEIFTGKVTFTKDKFFKWEAKAMDEFFMIVLVRGPSRRFVIAAVKHALDTLGISSYKVKK